MPDTYMSGERTITFASTLDGEIDAHTLSMSDAAELLRAPNAPRRTIEVRRGSALVGTVRRDRGLVIRLWAKRIDWRLDEPATFRDAVDKLLSRWGYPPLEVRDGTP